MMPKFSCYSFMSARTLAKILNYLRGKYPPCQLLLAENAFFLLFQRLALLFQFGRWNPSCPSVQSFNSHIRSILLPIYFLFLLIRAFSTFASNVLFHAHQNSVDIYIFLIFPKQSKYLAVLLRMCNLILTDQKILLPIYFFLGQAQKEISI